MKFRTICLLSLLFSGINCLAQFNTLLHKEYGSKVVEINDFYHKNIQLSYPEARKKAEALKSFAKRNKDISLELEADLYLAYYIVHYQIGTEKEQINSLLEVAEHGEKEKIFDIEARAIKVIRDYYWFDKKNYEIGFEYGLKLDQILKKADAKNFPDLADFYCAIGSGYYLFRDYHTAIKYYKKVMDIPETSFNWKSLWSAANTLGLCYQKLNNTDSSDYYFKKAVASGFIEKKSFHYSISMGNIGYNRYRNGKFEEAKPLLRNDVSNAVKEKDYGLAVGSLIPLADIYIYEKKHAEAWKLLQEARIYIEKSGQKERYENLFPVISRWYDTQGIKEKAILYKDSAIIATNNNNNTFSGLMLLRVQQKIDRDKLEQTERNTKIKTILLLVFLAVIVVFGLLYYTYLKKIYKEKEKTKEAELKFSEEQLENAKKEINSFLKEIEDKNQLIAQLQYIDDSAQNSTAIEKIRKMAILTEEDWEKFRLAFEHINPGYIERLKTKFPNITPAEIRIIVLSRLNLSHKEIANILGISAQSSRVTWHRLRKKLNINDDVSLHKLSLEV